MLLQPINPNAIYNYIIEIYLINHIFELLYISKMELKLDETTKLQNLSKEKDNLKQKIVESLAELYFLKNNGLICDLHISTAKDRYSSLISDTKDEDIISDQKFSQLLDLKFDEPVTAITHSDDQLRRKRTVSPDIEDETVTVGDSISPPPEKKICEESPLVPDPAISKNDSRLDRSNGRDLAAKDRYSSLISDTKDEDSISDQKFPQSLNLKYDEPLTEITLTDDQLRRKRSASPDIENANVAVGDSISPPPEKKTYEESPLVIDAAISKNDSRLDRTNGLDSMENESGASVRSERLSPVKPLEESPTRISKVVDPIVTPTVSADNQQRLIVERAKHEAAVTARIAELRKKGLWSAKRLPKLQEPPRPKTHWDYLLEEMKWLSADFESERKWKRKAAKKCAYMVYRYHQEKRSKIERAERERLQHIKKLAASQAKEIRSFWSSIEKIVDFRQQTKLEETRKKAWGLHLNYILDQTSKFSDTCMEDTNITTKDKEMEIDYLISQEGEKLEKETVIIVSIQQIWAILEWMHRLISMYSIKARQN